MESNRTGQYRSDIYLIQTINIRNTISNLCSIHVMIMRGKTGNYFSLKKNLYHSSKASVDTVSTLQET